MASNRPRAPLALIDDILNLDDVTSNLPSSAPMLRSFSKSCLRDPSQKHPPPARAQVIDRAEDDISVQTTAQTSTEHIEETPLVSQEPPSERSCPSIEQLPAEILESIVGHLGGQLGLTGAKHASRYRDWTCILRHPRRKEITNLALISFTWRRLVQERIFRHSE